RGPFPAVAVHLDGTVVTVRLIDGARIPAPKIEVPGNRRTGGAVKFGLCGKALPAPAGIALGLAPGNINRPGKRQWNFGEHAAIAPPPVSFRPEERRIGPVAHVLEIFAVGHFVFADRKSGDFNAVRAELVVPTETIRRIAAQARRAW